MGKKEGQEELPGLLCPMQIKAFSCRWNDNQDQSNPSIEGQMQ